jgi:ubiquinone/menaquinone biosynthesis C-methylase UbiE
MVDTAHVTAQPNLAGYHSQGLADYYASLNYLTAAERFLFEKFLHKGMVILDLGVGGGRTTPYLSSIANRYVGVDYSNAMIDACRKKFPKLEFEVAAAEDLSKLASSTFDAVVMAFNAVDYVFPEASRLRAIREVHRVLKPGGFFIFSSHNARSILVRPSWNPIRLRKLAESIVSPTTPLFRPIYGILVTMRIVLAWLQATGKTLARAFQRLTKRTFWRGRGYQMDSAHGGLITFFGTPEQIRHEFEVCGFSLLEMLGDDYPLASHLYTTDWYYYVFSKTGANLEK